MSDPVVSIVIVNAGVYDLLADCLRSIALGTRVAYEVIVVDNLVDLNRLSALSYEFGPAVTWLPMARNIGFAAGCNLGAAKASGSHILLLNPDTVVPPAAIDELVMTLSRHPRVGIMGCRLLNADGSDQTSSYGLDPSLMAMCLDSLGLQHVWRSVRRSIGPRSRDREMQPAAWAKGACLLIRPHLWRTLGGFDESFFMFGEDADLCRRARAAHYDVGCARDTAIAHFGGESYAASGVREQSIRDLYAGYERYVKKHQGSGRFRIKLLRAFMWIAALNRFVTLSVVACGRAPRREVASAYWRYVRHPRGRQTLKPPAKNDPRPA